mmetsp:Transcript_5477/g.16139  ORF Transcript_5477/g.16139 Transcript_5477/m.16139 type:complete len:218 (+) Transcript_5477:50-703(+)
MRSHPGAPCLPRNDPRAMAPTTPRARNGRGWTSALLSGLLTRSTNADRSGRRPRAEPSIWRRRSARPENGKGRHLKRPPRKWRLNKTHLEACPCGSARCSLQRARPPDDTKASPRTSTFSWTSCRRRWVLQIQAPRPPWAVHRRKVSSGRSLTVFQNRPQFLPYRHRQPRRAPSLDPRLASRRGRRLPANPRLPQGLVGLAPRHWQHPRHRRLLGRP